MKVIERTSKDVENETVELFNKCKPYFDKGYGFNKTIRIVKNIRPSSNFQNNSWYKQFKAYAKSQGYEPLK